MGPEVLPYFHALYYYYYNNDIISFLNIEKNFFVLLKSLLRTVIIRG